MKKALLICAVLLFISSVVLAQQLPPLGYIGLYADMEDPGTAPECTVTDPTPGARENWCITVAGEQFLMWVWALPGENSMKCAEFAVSYPPSGIFAGTACLNPAQSVAQGSLAGGLSICFTDCNYDWQWIAVQPIFVMAPTALVFEIIEHPTTFPAPIYQFANCLEDYPKEPCILFTNLYVNGDCGPIATEESSWGAIKDLFK